MSGSFDNYADYYTQGPYSADLREARIGGSAAVRMFDVRQPPGDFSDPPLPELVIIQATSHGIRGHCDLGAGRFKLRPAKGAIVAVAPGEATDIIVDNPIQFASTRFRLPI